VGAPMLVMTRKVGERIVIGDNVTVTVVMINGGVVRIGVEAPRDFSIMRSELLPGSPAESHPNTKRQAADGEADRF